MENTCNSRFEGAIIRFGVEYIVHFEEEVGSESDVVLIPTDGSKKGDWGWDTTKLGSALWLAEALNVNREGGWINYFSDLLGNDDGGGSSNNDGEVDWFALNFKGRSILSGLGEAPRVLELLGQQLQPMELLDDCTQQHRAPVNKNLWLLLTI